MLINDIHLQQINSPKQTIKASVELYRGSTLEKECTCSDILSSFQIERGGEGKFFGYGICQKLKVGLADINREISENNIDNFIISYYVEDNKLSPYPRFYKDTIERDELTNLLTVNAFDCLYNANGFTFSELGINAPYTLLNVAEAASALIGANGVKVIGADLSKSYTEGANVAGDETLRSVLNAIAEATQTIYYIDESNNLVFKRLEIEGEAVYTIDKNKYFLLSSNGNRILSDICAATELGDNVTATTGAEGETQYIRDNPFFDVETDIAAVLESAIAAVGGMTIEEFECDWMGNYLLEIGDKIEITSEDNALLTSYVLDETIAFAGTLSQLTRWSFGVDDNETASNPSTLGAVLKKTSAKVDKVNQRIELIAARVDEQGNNFTTIIEQLPDEITLKIQQEGVERVTTQTGYIFDEEGLTIEKAGSDIKTTISEDGMQVFKNEQEVLTANNEGVSATDLHARTYIWIGAYSRLEDYGTGRTGCFYVGG